MALSNDSPTWVFLFISLVFVAITQALAYGIEPSSNWPWPPSIAMQTAAAAMIVQWVAFIPAAIYDTEKYYDFTGSLTYISCTLFSLLRNGTDKIGHRQAIASALVLVWTIRLGTFLFARMLRDKKDGRFDAIRARKVRFFNAWTIQGAWVFITAMPVFAVNTFTAAESSPLGLQDYIGYGIWGFGFLVEVLADRQKSNFKEDPENAGKFINVGLWYYSRHPNYFGEIVLWIGMFVTCSVDFKKSQWVAILSPLFVVFLLTKVSGIPMLEKRADEKFGDDPAYIAYRESTSVLIPLPKSSKSETQAPLLGSNNLTKQ